MVMNINTIQHSINQSINQSINRSINQSINHRSSIIDHRSPLSVGALRGRGHARRVSVGVPVQPSDLLLSQRESQLRLHPPTTGKIIHSFLF